MADEYQLYWLGAETVQSDESAAQVYHLTAEIVKSDPSAAQTYLIQLEVIRAPWNKSNLSLLDDTDDAADALDTQFYVDAVRPNIPGTTDDFPGFTLAAWLITDPDVPIEWNPYSQAVPTHVADDDPESFDFQREQAETLREQHNLTQAGDTTFPWELMFKVSPTREYNLGSITRFFHPVYGILLARYVQFSDRWLGNKQIPVGHDTKYTDWIVTDDPTKSHWTRLVGVSLPFETDVGGKFGWALVQGRGLIEFFIEGPDEPAIYRQFTWGSAGYGVFGAGKSLGHVLDSQWTRELLVDGASYNPKRWRLHPGSWAVDVEGVTEEYLASIIEQETASLDERVTALEEAPAPEVVDYSGDITALESSVGVLEGQLTQEINTRYNADRSLQNRIETLEASTSGGGSTLAEFYILQDRVTALEDVWVPTVEGLVTDVGNVTSRVSTLEAWRTGVDSQLSGLATGSGAILSDPQLVELIQDTVGTMLTEGSDINLTYDDTAGTLEIESTAAGGGSGALTHIGSDVATAGDTTLTVGSIPGTFKDLVVVYYGRSNAVTGGAIATTVNAISSGYDLQRMFATGAVEDGDEFLNQASWQYIFSTVPSGDTAGFIAGGTMELLGYADTSFNTLMIATARQRQHATSGAAFIVNSAGQVRSTAAITSVTLTLPDGFAANSRLEVYGRG